MTMKRLIATPSIAFCTAIALPSFAAGPGVDINGFVSVGGGYLSVDDESFSENRGYEDELTFSQETVFGIQFDSELSEQLSVTGQVISRGIDDYETEAAWAYFSYDATDDLRIRMGRFRVPYYFYSDYLEVGYAYHFISPSVETYNIPFDSVDGIDVLYQNYLGDIDTSFQIYAGSIDSDFLLDGTQEVSVSARSAAGVVLSLNYEILTLRASHHTTDFSVNNISEFALPEAATAALGEGVTNVGQFQGVLATQGFTEAADRLNFDDVNLRFTEFAAKIDWNNILLLSEYTFLTNDDTGPIGEWNRLFVTAGYTIGDWMFHASFSSAEDDRAPLSDSITTNSTDPQVIGQTALFGAITDGVTDQFIALTDTISYGVRYDFDTGAALKFEVSDITEKTEAEDLKATLFRFSVDLVF